jgi:hypothetical protein
MAMLITRFNKLIRSRILWGGLAFLIAFAFVGSSIVSDSGCAQQQPQGNTAGRLFDAPVAREAYHAARYFELGMRRAADLSEAGEALIHERTWQRLAALRMADDMGIAATDRELGEMIRRDPAFAVNGVFDSRQYRGVVQQQLGVPVSTFEDYSRQELVLRKVEDALGAAAWMAPTELRYRLRNFTDRMTVETAHAPDADNTANGPAISAAEIEAYYADHREDFREPDQVRVRYVRFPVEPSTNTPFTADEMEDYYDEHLDTFSSVNTNGTDTLLPLSNATVRAAVLDGLAARRALFAARDAATDLVMTLAPDRSGEAPSFEAAAAAIGLSVSTTAYFAADTPVPGLDVPAEFNRWAFRIEAADPESYFSDAISASNAVYVIAAADRRAAHVPELDAVRDAVRAAAEAAAKEDARVARGTALRDALTARMQDEGAGFAEAAEALEMNVSTAMTFTVFGLIEEGAADDAGALIETAPTLAIGDVSTPIPTMNGWMFVHLVNRVPGDPATASLLRSELQSAYRQYRVGLAVEDWKRYTLAQGNLEDHMRLALDAETE